MKACVEMKQKELNGSAVAFKLISRTCHHQPPKDLKRIRYIDPKSVLKRHLIEQNHMIIGVDVNTKTLGMVGMRKFGPPNSYELVDWVKEEEKIGLVSITIDPRKTTFVVGINLPREDWHKPLSKLKTNNQCSLRNVHDFIRVLDKDHRFCGISFSYYDEHGTSKPYRLVVEKALDLKLSELEGDSFRSYKEIEDVLLGMKILLIFFSDSVYKFGSRLVIQKHWQMIEEEKESKRMKFQGYTLGLLQKQGTSHLEELALSFLLKEGRFSRLVEDLQAEMEFSNIKDIGFSNFILLLGRRWQQQEKKFAHSLKMKALRELYYIAKERDFDNTTLREISRSISSWSVLISGMGHLGVEIARNLIFAGVKSVTLHDECRERAHESAEKLRLFNDKNEVVIYTSMEKLTNEKLSDFQAVVFTDISLDKAIEFNDFCHNHQPSISFIKVEVRGSFGYVFSDFGPKFTVVNVDEEDPHTGTVTQLKQPKVLNFKPLREALNERLKFQHGDKPYWFVLKENTAYYDHGTAKLDFMPLRHALGELILKGFSKFDQMPVCN